MENINKPIFLIRGAQSTVYSLNKVENGQIISEALKRFKYEHDYKHEFSILIQLATHKNVVEMKGFDPYNYVIAFNQGQNWDKNQFPNSPNSKIFLGKLKFTFEVLQGLKHLRSQGINHLDIKMSNIIIGSNGLPQIIDFGRSRINRADDKNVIFNQGTKSHQSPQDLNQICYSGEKNDVFQFGCTIVEFYFGIIAFPQGFYQDNLLNQLIQTIYQTQDYIQFKKDPANQNLIDSIIQLIYWMLQYDETKRPTLLEIENYLNQIYSTTNHYLINLKIKKNNQQYEVQSQTLNQLQIQF